MTREKQGFANKLKMARKEAALQFIIAWKTELASATIIAICLFLAYLFPAQGLLQNFSRSLFFLVLLPVLYIKFILKQDLRNYGLNLQNKKIGLLWVLAMLALSFLIIFLLIHFFHFETKYFLPAYLAQNFWLFLFYELVIVNFIIFINEFFFRGFVLFTFSKKIGFWSVAIQALLFILFLISIGNFGWQMTPMIILSLTGALVAYKSKSFIYSYLMELFLLIILDSYIIYIFK